eukprot:4318878-Pleurochrysis_carterae.AAC.1
MKYSVRRQARDCARCRAASGTAHGTGGERQRMAQAANQGARRRKRGQRKAPGGGARLGHGARHRARRGGTRRRTFVAGKVAVLSSWSLRQIQGWCEGQHKSSPFLSRRHELIMM